MNDWLLEIMQCPLSGEKLRAADPSVVAKLHSQQQAGELFSHKGIALDEAFESGLTNQSTTFFYRIIDDIPVLLPDEAIALPAS